MGRRVEDFDDDDRDDEFGDAEDDSYEEEDDADDDKSVPCPACKRDVYEDAERCPYCGEYLSDLDKQPARKPWWVVLGAVVCLYLVYRWVMG